MNKQLDEGRDPFEGCNKTAESWLKEGIPDVEWKLLEGLGLRRLDAQPQSYESFLRGSKGALVPNEILAALVTLAKSADTDFVDCGIREFVANTKAAAICRLASGQMAIRAPRDY